MSDRQAGRDLSYASLARTRRGTALIRMIENSTGRLGLVRRASGYREDIAAGQNFFSVMARRYGLSLEVVGGSVHDIPRTGPLILIANHPYGILDGLTLGLVLSQRREDFRILANSVFSQAPDLDDFMLPINFEVTREAQIQNLETRRNALKYIENGGAIGIFPGGTVSTGAKAYSKPMDPAWRGFTARMIAKSDAVVVPVYFDGSTSRMFQIASHLHPTLRLGLLINEFRKRVDTPVRVAVGAPIGREILQPLTKDSKAMMDFLRKATYELSSEPVKCFDLGYEFKERPRRRDADGSRHI